MKDWSQGQNLKGGFLLGVWERPDPTFKVDSGTRFKVGCSPSLFQSFCARILGVVWQGRTKIQNPSNFDMGVQGAIPDLTNFDIVGFDGPLLIYSSFFSRELTAMKTPFWCLSLNNNDNFFKIKHHNTTFTELY